MGLFVKPLDSVFAVAHTEGAGEVVGVQKPETAEAWGLDAGVTGINRPVPVRR